MSLASLTAYRPATPAVHPTTVILRVPTKMVIGSSSTHSRREVGALGPLLSMGRGT